MISIIVPTLNEQERIGALLAALHSLPGAKEIIVADGHSDDATAPLALQAGARVIHSPRGRGHQLHAGAQAAAGDILWFVHADTTPPPHALHEITRALADPAAAAGNFRLIFDGNGLPARQMTWLYPKLRHLGLSYGDAGIFVRRSIYERSGGFRPLALFEDLDLIRRLRQHGGFLHLDARLVTSSRRFQGWNYPRVWTLWITLQLLYWMGVCPNRLARWYRQAR